MALPREDMWLGVAALGAAAFGYWWLSRSSSNASTGTPATTATNEPAAASPLVQGMDTQANNVVGASEIYQQGNAVGYASPQGNAINSYGQSFPLPTNS